MSGPRLSIIPAAAVLDRRLQRGDLDVLCLLGMSSDKNGWTRRSQVKMAKQLEIARSTVQASLNRLVDAGWVVKRVLSVPGESGQRDSAHEYRVVLDVEDAPELINNNDELPLDPCRYTGTPADPPAPPADPDRHLINDLTINDSIPHSVRNSAPPARSSNSVMGELLAVLDSERARAVIEHRKAIRRPLTPHAAKLLARKLALVPNPNMAADAMIGNGWQGFEPHWMENRNTGRGGAPPGRPASRPPSGVEHLRSAIQKSKEISDETGRSRGNPSIDGEFWNSQREGQPRDVGDDDRNRRGISDHSNSAGRKPV